MDRREMVVEEIPCSEIIGHSFFGSRGRSCIAISYERTDAVHNSLFGTTKPLLDGMARTL